MQFYEFGCAPQAVKDGFNPSVTIFHGTTEEAQTKFAGQDVAVVYGASIQGSDGFEFGVMSRTPSTKESAVNYLFYVEGLNREVWQAGESRKAAHAALWASLSEAEKNRVVQIECIDEESWA